MHARNPAHSLQVGGNWMMFSPVASPPNCSDLERGRRPGNRADFRDFLKLGQYFNILHLTGGYTVEPIDIAPDIRHLEALRDIYTMTDKPTHSYSWAGAGSATASRCAGSRAASTGRSSSASRP